MHAEIHCEYCYCPIVHNTSINMFHYFTKGVGWVEAVLFLDTGMKESCTQFRGCADLSPF